MDANILLQIRNNEALLYYLGNVVENLQHQLPGFNVVKKYGQLNFTPSINGNQEENQKGVENNHSILKVYEQPNLIPIINENQVEIQVGVESNQKKEKYNSTKRANGLNANALILIRLWNVDGIYQFIDKHYHLVYYYTREVINGKVKVCIGYGDILKTFPGIKWMIVFTICDTTAEVIKTEEESPHILNLEEEGNESNMLSFDLKTNGKSENTIALSFLDEKIVQRFTTFFKLRDSSTKYETVNKMKIINDYIEKFKEVPKEYLDRSIQYGLDVMRETLKMAIKKKIFKEENLKILENAVNKFLKNPEKEAHENLRYILFSLAKNEEMKKKLSKLYFDSLYKYIYSIDENVVNTSQIDHFNAPIYKQFLKEYFIGPCRENRIVFTMDDMKEEIHDK